MIVFAGLCTLDIIQLVSAYPASDEKVTALAQTVAAGGPATNAAATAAALGAHAVLLTAVGRHPLAAGIHADLAALGVELIDLAVDDSAPPVSSIVVSAGDRAVVSTNGGTRSLSVPDLSFLRQARAVQVDGHYPALALPVLREARRLGIPTVLDAGSWKPTTPDLLPYLDVVVCSADFHPPARSSDARSPAVTVDSPPSGVSDISAFLAGHGVRWIAISQGPGPILRWTGDTFHEHPVPRTTVVDTLGAGDVLHGALTTEVARRWPLTDGTFAESLTEAATVASRSCASFGTRTWMP